MSFLHLLVLVQLSRFQCHTLITLTPVFITSADYKYLTQQLNKITACIDITQVVDYRESFMESYINRILSYDGGLFENHLF